jgi:hypothetical protein
MNEKDLVELWNDKRRQLIHAQLQSVIALSVLTVLAVMGYFSSVSTNVVLFALLFLVTVGVLGLINQFAVIREAKSLVEDLQREANLSAIGKTISGSGRYLGLTQALMVIFSLGLLVVFVLVAFSL